MLGPQRPDNLTAGAHAHVGKVGRQATVPVLVHPLLWLVPALKRYIAGLCHMAPAWRLSSGGGFAASLAAGAAVWTARALLHRQAVHLPHASWHSQKAAAAALRAVGKDIRRGLLQQLLRPVTRPPSVSLPAGWTLQQGQLRPDLNKICEHCCHQPVTQPWSPTQLNCGVLGVCSVCRMNCHSATKALRL